MMICYNCKNKIPDNAVFCPICGTKQAVSQQSQSPAPSQICPNCGKMIKEGQLFCTGCGYRFAQPQGQQRPHHPQQGYQQPQQHSQQRPQQPRQHESESSTPYIKIMLISIACIFAALFFVLGFMFVYNKFIKKDNSDQTYEAQSSEALSNDNEQISDMIETEDKSDDSAEKSDKEDAKDKESEEEDDQKKDYDADYDFTDGKMQDFEGSIGKDSEGNYVLILPSGG